MIRSFLSSVREIADMVHDPARSMTFYPDERRKSKARIWADLLAWRLTRGEVNEFYYSWGMDRVDAPRARDLLSYREFKRMRNTRNRSGAHGLNYTALMRDKYLFTLVMESLGYPTPPLHALLEGGRIRWLRPRHDTSYDALLEAGPLDLFCKPRYGIQGRDSFRVQVENGLLCINGKPHTAADLERMAPDSILQQRIIQHPQMAALYPTAVNTLRIITVRDRTAAQLFSRPMLKMGIGGAVVDNGRQGGLQAFVDPATGRVIGPAVRHRGGLVSRHPDTDIALDGFQIPFFEEAIGLVASVHGELPGPHSVGWDVAFTESGPVLLEGNDDWGGAFRIGLEPGFREAFEAVCARE